MLRVTRQLITASALAVPPMSRFRSPVLAAITAAAVTATVVGGVAVAQTGTATITACVADRTGNIRIVGGPSECKPNETVSTWNQQGLQGPPGPAGPQGAPGVPGAPGATGSPGVSGLTYVERRVDSTLTPGGGTHHNGGAFVQCPAGKYATGGGYSFSGGVWNSGPQFVVSQNAPSAFTFDKPFAWSVSITAFQSFSLIVYVICASA